MATNHLSDKGRPLEPPLVACEPQLLAPAPHSHRERRWSDSTTVLLLLLLSSLVNVWYGFSNLYKHLSAPPAPVIHGVEAVVASSEPSSLWAMVLESCAWTHLEPHVSLLDVPPITRDEFLSRQRRLARALDAAGVDAFVAEPSASTTYYANVSSSFDLSERPFLVVLGRDGQLTTLVPKFEAGRIGKLSMVHADGGKKTVTWAEEESPYEALLKATGYDKVMVDEHARYMIASGLHKAGAEIVSMSEDVQSLRSVKTDAEIAILRGINHFTLELVRSVQKCIQIGDTQDTLRMASHALFRRAGVGKGFWAIILFGSQAAYPHGGETGRALPEGEFVLIDIGSLLHGYGSDVTRTILPNGTTVSDDLMDIWHTVRAAQTAGFERMAVDQTCSDIDAAARKVVEDAGFGPFFTHRLGHGLGLEMHELPYLNGANGEKLKLGEVATNEPGIYVTTEEAELVGREIGFGVRLEDPILVTEDGGVPMTGRRAQSPWDP